MDLLNYFVPVKLPPKSLFSKEDKSLHKKYLSKAKRLISGKTTPEKFAVEMTKLHIKLEALADHDGLVKNFLNNHGFAEALQRELQTMKRFKSTEGVLVALDIDLFKRFNDNLGHPKGDRLIKLYARVIEKYIRSNDIKGRVGGDEFLVFLIGTNIENAKIVAERIRVGIPKEVKRSFKNSSWEQTTSIGLTQVQTEDSLNTIRERADKALYQAKQARNSMVSL